MSTLKLYGYSKSRAVRTLWMLEELGITYEQVPVGEVAGSTRTAAYLAINPAGHVPAIDDGGFKLSESMAINLYLAKKHGKLYPATPQGEAKAWQWSFWAIGELDKLIFPWIMNSMLAPVEQRSAKAALAAREELEWPLTVIEAELARQQYLAEPQTFTVGDLNVASVMYWLLHVDLSGKPHLEAWLKRCWKRPAAIKARAMREA